MVLNSKNSLEFYLNSFENLKIKYKKVFKTIIPKIIKEKKQIIELFSNQNDNKFKKQADRVETKVIRLYNKYLKNLEHNNGNINIITTKLQNILQKYVYEVNLKNFLYNTLISDKKIFKEDMSSIVDRNIYNQVNSLFKFDNELYNMKKFCIGYSSFRIHILDLRTLEIKKFSLPKLISKFSKSDESIDKTYSPSHVQISNDGNLIFLLSEESKNDKTCIIVDLDKEELKRGKDMLIELVTIDSIYINKSILVFGEVYSNALDVFKYDTIEDKWFSMRKLDNVKYENKYFYIKNTEEVIVFFGNEDNSGIATYNIYNDSWEKNIILEIKFLIYKPFSFLMSSNEIIFIGGENNDFSNKNYNGFIYNISEEKLTKTFSCDKYYTANPNYCILYHNLAAAFNYSSESFYVLKINDFIDKF